jgi:hypothetical protein
MVSVVERDGPALRVPPDAGVGLLEPFAHALRGAGMHVKACRAATTADVADLGSSWAKRLGIPARRPAWCLTARRQPAGASDHLEAPSRLIVGAAG